jgi:diguanylate cyclase (GGDEF)-like protein/PAS domain S-box-containing protein
MSQGTVLYRAEDTALSPTTDEIARAHDDATALRASELRYRRLFETAQDGIFILDAETGRITDVNPFMEAMIGYSHDELMGKSLWEIGPVKDILASQDAMRHLQDKEYIRYEDLPLETKTKKRVQVEFVSNVYLVDGARVIQCNVRDITERKRAEAEARKLTEDLVEMVAGMKQRDVEMSRVNHMSDLLQACASQVEAYQVIALMAGELFVGHSGFLAVLNPRNRRLETVARWGDESAIVPSFDLNDCWAMRRGQPHEVVDPHGGLVCLHFLDQPATGYLCVPLSVQGETLGLLCLIGAPHDATKGVVKQQLAVTMGEAIKLSLSNLRLREKLREQATLDVLTGLYNRRFLDESLARELHRSLRQKSPLCVAMLDLDHFKRFNDAFGHQAGDLLLREMGRVLRENMRKSDVSCRYGGEEFVLVFPDSTLADTRLRVEQVRSLVGQLELRLGDQRLGKVTLSAGIVQASADGSTPGEMLRAADEALYAAKQAGRDRTVEYAQRT